MKKVLVLMLVTVMLAVTSMAFAGGGQNTNTLHGDDGAGGGTKPRIRIAPGIGYDFSGIIHVRGKSLGEYFRECADAYGTKRDKVSVIIGTMTELPANLAKYFSELEEESRGFQGMAGEMKSDVGSVAGMVLVSCLEDGDDVRFKRVFSAMPDKRKKKVLDSMLGSFEEGDGDYGWAEEWLTRRFPDLSMGAARKMVDDNGGDE